MTLRCPSCNHLAFWHGFRSKAPTRGVWGMRYQAPRDREGCIHGDCTCPLYEVAK